ncbi:cardiolipin synthase [Tessaracoccus lacteus]|uniref:Cardiolipin synthase n=1 Tax=Tessaracoccus lacteus TaxID=3041766 RepID=A0ABY8PY00_9ACTN|nr:cardiolipin synthase [Tessaracoccus sp. T21]WGT47361.1 cardiolipin synthase [Tessaracoccus sp. T21]
MNGDMWINVVWTATLLIDLVIRIVLLMVVPRNRKPTSAMAWLLAIMLIPYLGTILFLLIGFYHLPKRRRDEQKLVDRLLAEHAADVPIADPGWPRWFQRVVEQNRALTHLPAVAGNSAVLITDYREQLDAMTREIEKATRFVHVEFYIASLDDTTRGFFEAMENAVKRGVTVRLLTDHIASRKLPGAKHMLAELDRMGVQWAWMLPVQPLKGKYQRPDLRNHRKLLVVDGTVAFIGSQNLIDRTYNSKKNHRRGLKWVELVARVEGPTVAAIDAVFFTDWLAETGEELISEHIDAPEVPAQPQDLLCQIVPSGPGYETENNLRLFLSLIHGATERVIITSPYFVPDEAMLYAMTIAKQRGLDVQLFVSEIGDQAMVFHAQRSYYEELLVAGVRIFLYPGPYILHSKFFSVDDDIAVIGSSNMDIRSFTLNCEVSMMVRGESFVADMRAVEARYREISRELTLEDWRKEPLRRTFWDGIARLASALN